MIKQTNLRGGEDPIEFERPAMRALESMVLAELGFGGSVTEFSPTRVVVSTEVLGTRDTSIFEGSEKEMALIVKVAAQHAALMNTKRIRNALIKKTVNSLGEAGGLPFILAHLGPILMGERSTAFALLFAMNITDSEAIKTLVRIPLEDLMAAVALAVEADMPLLEVALAVAQS